MPTPEMKLHLTDAIEETRDEIHELIRKKFGNRTKFTLIIEHRIDRREALTVHIANTTKPECAAMMAEIVDDWFRK